MAGWSTEAWRSVASSVLSVGNVRSCNHTAAVKNLFQSWRKVWKPLRLEAHPEAWRLFLLQSRMYTPIDELSPCDLRIFLATKKGCSESMHLLYITNFCISSFVVRCFVISIFRDAVFVDVFYGFHGGQSICQYDVSRTRGLYVYTLFPRVLRFNSPVFVLPFSNPFMQFHCPLAPRISTSSLEQRWLHYCWGQWCFALLMQNMWICCVCRVWSKGSKNLCLSTWTDCFNVLYVQPAWWTVHHMSVLPWQWTFCWNMMTTTFSGLLTFSCSFSLAGINNF